jgi:hypothetical protein
VARPPKGKRVKAVDGSFTVSGKASNGEGPLYREEALAGALESRPPSPATALSGSSTIAELASWWSRSVANVRVRPSSLGDYVDRVDRITAWLGDVRLGSLRAEQVATWQAALLKTLAASTVADTRATFRSIIDEAVSLDLIWTNPVDRVRPPVVRLSSRGRDLLHSVETAVNPVSWVRRSPR